MYGNALKQTGRFVLFLALGFACVYAGTACINVSPSDLFSKFTTDITAVAMFAVFFFTPWTLAAIKRLFNGHTIIFGTVFAIAAVLFFVFINVLAGWALMLWDFGKVIYAWATAGEK